MPEWHIGEMVKSYEPSGPPAFGILMLKYDYLHEACLNGLRLRQQHNPVDPAALGIAHSGKCDPVALNL
ncbi:hypothetical protein ETH_00001815 [Eimeria tenella]|uniref:Uncharacterized protein n=1 Tax=Eimeria tenella TaxID=5802 RepID=U6KVV5_EIMTE|nr:hypothetical protein ETH_00001815 [Eimeria tenella]CDJ42272.1 hypothetical protein ETH_00001815 [Eimeria tenella]|eukprot:XP_013233022.1 hypothetical protein ETH_00001815 [Eimeria tenella]